MRTLVIPDLHEDLEFLEYIFETEDTSGFDHIILLGDYFDRRGGEKSHPNELRLFAQAIVRLKDKFGERLNLLWGNHDLPYYALRPACRGNADRANWVIGGALDATSLRSAEIINQVWAEEFWKKLQGAVLIDGWLYSHAGVSKHWWPREGKSPTVKTELFGLRWTAAIESIYDEDKNPLFAAGKARGGIAEFGGPLWLDWDQEFEDHLEVPQIVGHTCGPEIRTKGRSHCIDVMQSVYAIVDGATVRHKFWPQSSLGRLGVRL